jgi:serine/threonine protein kinase
LEPNLDRTRKGPAVLAANGDGSSAWDQIVAEFIDRWERGETPPAEDYLARLDEANSDEAIELIYHEFCLAESAGLEPDPAAFLRRFPTQQEMLARLFRLHGLFDSQAVAAETAGTTGAELPEAGDEIGPYVLVRELGRGAFARVFLAEQTDLDDRPVVVKVSTRITPEARLLARARHPHIVEILHYATVDEGRLQLLCMPFLGGATLAAVLEECRGAGKRPNSGSDLLAALDRVSAREYTVASPARPARQLVARLNDAQALAWIVARLAEALDHALARGVAHGDVKPSNILIAADGTPMLLDFNLAVDDRSDLEAAGGGTLAYMAPERLADLIGAADGGPVARRGDRHRADIYALGLVLLEALTGQPRPAPVVLAAPKTPREIARALMEQRWEGAEALLRDLPGPLPRGLRSILEHCLASDPAERYARAAELAEDLDRWRADRSLIYAPDVPWPHRLGRWARRQSLALTALGLCLVIGISSGTIVWNTSRATLRAQALAKLDQFWGTADPNVYRFRDTGQWRDIDLSQIAELAQRNLKLYDVLGPGDWRRRDDVRSLPEAERLDLESWLLEQGYRLAEALADRPDSPNDWRRALTVLGKAGGDRALRPYENLHRRLRDQLGRDAPPESLSSERTRPTPEWLEAFLRGIEAERTRVPEALSQFRTALALRPGTYWADYRAAAAAFRLGDAAATVFHLRRCLARRPRNAALHSQIVGSLVNLKRIPEALDELERAERLDPDLKDIYRIRTPIWAQLGQDERVRSDLRRFALLTRGRGQAPTWEVRLFSGLDGDRDQPRFGDPTATARRLLEVDPEDARVRDDLGLHLARAGQEWEALSELTKLLEADPDYLPARFHRALVRLNLRGEGVDDDLAYVFDHPRLEELLRAQPAALQLFFFASQRALERGQTREALELANRGLETARRMKSYEAESHYAVARACAADAQARPERVAEAAAHLNEALRLQPGRIGVWYENDQFFDEQRPRLGPFIVLAGGQTNVPDAP